MGQANDFLSFLSLNFLKALLVFLQGRGWWWEEGLVGVRREGGRVELGSLGGSEQWLQMGMMIWLVFVILI